jgi:hypothetical protein
MLDLVSLAATNKQLYNQLREHYRVIYWTLAPYAIAELGGSLSGVLYEQSIMKPRKPGPEWYVAAARLCMWPGGHRTFLGFSWRTYGSWCSVLTSASRTIIPSLTDMDMGQAIHSAGREFACEDAQFASCQTRDWIAKGNYGWQGTPFGFATTDVRETHSDQCNPSSYGMTAFLWSWWHLFPSRFAGRVLHNPGRAGSVWDKEEETRTLSELPRTIETLWALLKADSAPSVRPLEELYWAIVFRHIAPTAHSRCPHPPKRTRNDPGYGVSAGNAHARAMKRQRKDDGWW